MSYVYVVSDFLPAEGPDGLLDGVETVKIGFTSNDVSSRISQLQTGNPKKIHLVYLYHFHNSEMAKQAEKMCHWSLSGYEATGEWFHYCEAVHSVLEALKSFAVFESSTFPSDAALAACRKISLAVNNG
jgi:hypothetical protein